jgi:hypothetical protein
MSRLRIRRHAIALLPDSGRVIIRPFIPSDIQRITTIIGRALALTEEEVVRQLAEVRLEFASRHFEIEPSLIAHFEKVKHHLFTLTGCHQTVGYIFLALAALAPSFVQAVQH